MSIKKGNVPWNKGMAGNPNYPLRGRKQPPEVVSRRIAARKTNGQPWHSERTKKRIGFGGRGKKVSLSTRRQISKSLKGRSLSLEHKRKIGQAHRGFTFTLESRKKMSKKAKLRKHSKASNMKRSLTMFKHWLDPEYQKKWEKGCRLSPNKLELLVKDVLDRLFPNQYQFVGDGNVWIGGKCPDFINTNGQKKLIEVLGDFWHGPEDVRKRADHFSKYGFKTLVLWEHDIVNHPEGVARKLARFHEKRERSNPPPRRGAVDFQRTPAQLKVGGGPI